MTVPRVLYADLVPYEVPSSLAALRGTSSGLLTLPRHLWWGRHRHSTWASEPTCSRRTA